MLTLLRSYQVSILIGCGLVCLLLAFFIKMIHFHSVRKKKALVKVQLGVAILMLMDACAYIFKGDQSLVGFYMTRISNFIVFAFVLANLLFLNSYITDLFMSSGKFDTLPKRLRLGFILPCIGIMLVILSQFWGLYYYFDSSNFYHRGPLFLATYFIPCVIMVLQFSFVIEYRKLLQRGILWSIILFSVLPLLAAFAQIFLYGLSLINLATWMAAVSLFCFALIDQNAELARVANTEVATGLPNVYGYMYEVDRIISNHNPTEYCGFYFDIVRMSHLNNKYGKNTGDVIIIKYAERIRSFISKDEVLGRLGGNFFVALVKKNHIESFLDFLRDVKVEIIHNNKPEILHIAAIAGGYEINSRNISAGQIMSRTSTAVNYAKVTRKPYAFLDDALEQEFQRILQMEENCRLALASREFEPFYQPKVDTEKNKVCGAEALARWQHKGKMVSPAEFIPIMEKNGSVCELDFCILNNVCRDIREWIDRGIKPPTVSVNFSRRNLDDQNITEKILAVIRDYKIPKNLIQIEITETLDDYEPSALISFVDKLHECGISVAIDDFGTGSSSIRLIKDIPFDTIKIDKSFVDFKDDKERQLLCNIIKMANDMDTEILAEGVESLDLVKELRLMGCNLIQGYVFDPPLKKEEFEKRLSNDV